MQIDQENRKQTVLDQVLPVKCPSCKHQMNPIPISFPDYEQLLRVSEYMYSSLKIDFGYVCSACFEPTPIRFDFSIDGPGHPFIFSPESYKIIEPALEEFDYEYLPEAVSKDFEEAVKCYSYQCYNAFGAMCRRTVQTMCTDLGKKGKTKVMAQLKQTKETTEMEDEIYEVLKQIVIDSGDGAHPHLPIINNDRADIIFALMKDILYELYVRKAKMQKAMKLREEQIEIEKQDG